MTEIRVTSIFITTHGPSFIRCA